MRHNLSALCAVFFCLSNTLAADAAKPIFTILFTAEAHGALLPCDCPLQPLGGVARRATLIKRFREQGPVVLVDAGGWAAGGLYDEDSDGDPNRDVLRTSLMLHAMELMKYDVMAFGESDRSCAGTLQFADFIGTVQRMPFYFGALVKRGPYDLTFQLIDTVPPSTPVVAAPAPTESALHVIAYRFGEQRLESSPVAGADLILNAGRKTSQRTDWRQGNALVANFDYQSRNLGVVEVFAAPAPKRFDLRIHFEPLGKDIPDDPEIAALLAPHLEALKKKGKQVIDVEYWMMPECPACKQARPELKALRAELEGRVRIVPHWVVERTGTELSSLHGPLELDEARIQSLVNKYYPLRIWDWFDWRDQHPKASADEGFAALKLLPVRLQQALLNKEGDTLLNADYDLAERRQIRSTPALVISNHPYEGEIERLHLLGALCGLLDEPHPPACKDAPKCFFDAQCRKRGFVARCIDPGKPNARCDSVQPAVHCPAVILYDPTALVSKHETILSALINDLPGLDYRMLDGRSGEGGALLDRAAATRLPAFLISPEAKKEAAFHESVGRVAREIESRPPGDAWNQWMLLREDQAGVGSRQFIARPRILGRADLFVSRYSKNGAEALEQALTMKSLEGLELIVHDAVFWNREEPPRLAALNGIGEIEEAERAEAVRRLAPDRFDAYLLERGHNRGSSYWDKGFAGLGIDAAAVRTNAEGPAPWILKILQDNATLLKHLDATGEIILLAENCESIPIISRVDLRHTLERIAQRKLQQRR